MLDLHEELRTTSSIEEDAITYARFNYYPHCPKPDQVLGLKPHTDATVITVVFYVSGLQVQKNGFWYKVQIVPNALLVNTGDAMEVRVCAGGFFQQSVVPYRNGLCLNFLIRMCYISIHFVS